MYEFKSSYKSDEYSNLIDELNKEIFELTNKTKSHFHEKETNIPDTVFITEVDNEDYEVIHEVTPKFKKDTWKNIVVQR